MLFLCFFFFFFFFFLWVLVIKRRRGGGGGGGGGGDRSDRTLNGAREPRSSLPKTTEVIPQGRGAHLIQMMMSK